MPTLNSLVQRMHSTSQPIYFQITDMNVSNVFTMAARAILR